MREEKCSEGRRNENKHTRGKEITAKDVMVMEIAYAQPPNQTYRDHLSSVLARVKENCKTLGTSTSGLCFGRVSRERF